MSLFTVNIKYSIGRYILKSQQKNICHGHKHEQQKLNQSFEISSLWTKGFSIHIARKSKKKTSSTIILGAVRFPFPSISKRFRDYLKNFTSVPPPPLLLPSRSLRFYVSKRSKKCLRQKLVDGEGGGARSDNRIAQWDVPCFAYAIQSVLTYFVVHYEQSIDK